jgi:hypothetical protein
MTTIHTYPDNDIIEHVTDGGECPCGPTTEPMMRDDGSNGWLVVHQKIGLGDVFLEPFADRSPDLPGGL